MNPRESDSDAKSVNDSDVVELTITDAGELLTLQRAAYVTEAQLHDDVSLPALTQSLLDLLTELSNSAVHAWGIRVGGRLVASMRIRVDRDVAEVMRLVVAPDMQGRGMGTRLLAAVDSVIPENVTRVELFTGERSVANIRLYERMGYREIRRRDTGPYDLVYLARYRD